MRDGINRPSEWALTVMPGDFPRRAKRLVLEWYEMHKDELHSDWTLAEERNPLKKIEPLE